jgi:hypothetical protein
LRHFGQPERSLAEISPAFEKALAKAISAGIKLINFFKAITRDLQTARQHDGRAREDKPCQSPW